MGASKTAQEGTQLNLNEVLRELKARPLPGALELQTPTGVPLATQIREPHYCATSTPVGVVCLMVTLGTGPGVGCTLSSSPLQDVPYAQRGAKGGTAPPPSSSPFSWGEGTSS